MEGLQRIAAQAHAFLIISNSSTIRPSLESSVMFISRQTQRNELESDKRL
jgi:UDP-N-acetylglucosamine 2-epimerase